MTRLQWGEVGTRKFEAGVDRGVLYPPNAADGVAWNGLISVKEAPFGGQPQSYYQDGVKYIQIASFEEFDATIEAFSAPAEFYLCDGTHNLYAGLLITQQPRQQFDFTYRSLVGNELLGEAFGYKIHLVYNALAKPALRTNQSLSNVTEPMTLSWDITTVPVPMWGIKPTAHLVIDTTTAPSAEVEAVENMLYGQEGVPPRMPTQTEVIELFQYPGPLSPP